MSSSFPTMPGAFPISPTAHISSSRSAANDQINDDNAIPQIVEDPAVSVLDWEQGQAFERKQYILQKSRNQYHALNQLHTLVIILAGYQFVKYCHSACLFPIVLHIALQKLLSPDVVTNKARFGLATAITHINQEYREDDTANNGQPRLPKDQVIKGLLRGMSQLIYVKFIVTSIYHIVFTTMWLTLITEAGKLKHLETGTWWFVSFLGESAPEDLKPGLSIWYKLIRLGLPGLIISDVAILLIQLVIFQAVYKQSTIGSGERRLNEEEVDIIRSPNEASAVSNNEIKVYENEAGILLVLRIKLYELLRPESYSRQVTDQN